MLFSIEKNKFIWLVEKDFSEYFSLPTGSYKNASVYQHPDLQNPTSRKKIHDTAHYAFWYNMIDEMVNE